MNTKARPILRHTEPKSGLAFFVFFIFLFVATLFSATGCRNSHQPQPPQQSKKVVSISGKTMGTTYSILVVSDTESSVTKKLQSLVDKRLEAINQKMSSYVVTSEISRFSHTEDTSWQDVSSETLEVLEEAQKISRQSDGTFDVTVGPLVNLWNFGPGAKETFTPPDQIVISKALTNIGFEKLELNLEKGQIRKSRPALKVNLSAIAKGYAVDQIGDLLIEHNYPNFMVEIGGEILTHGQKPGKKDWVIGVQNPGVSSGSDLMKVNLSGLAVATSGGYNNYFEYKGQKYSHTINPKDGWPVTHRLDSVTVFAESCMRADGLATALMVMGEKVGLAFAEEEKIAAIFLFTDAEGKKKVEFSSSVKTVLLKE
ncbi:MAG: FAD:protein FMN transferase [Pirellulaceae bacterium]|nr:FAD:protein FMN transferase [Pirellulaceae bacterium]